MFSNCYCFVGFLTFLFVFLSVHAWTFFPIGRWLFWGALVFSVFCVGLENVSGKSSNTWWLIPLSKWDITPVIYMGYVGLIHSKNWGYNPLTKWDEPPSSHTLWTQSYLLKGSGTGISFTTIWRLKFKYLLRQWPWIHRDTNLHIILVPLISVNTRYLMLRYYIELRYQQKHIWIDYEDFRWISLVQPTLVHQFNPPGKITKSVGKTWDWGHGHPSMAFLIVDILTYFNHT
jgi:hypothetical protein